MQKLLLIELLMEHSNNLNNGKQLIENTKNQNKNQNKEVQKHKIANQDNHKNCERTSPRSRIKINKMEECKMIQMDMKEVPKEVLKMQKEIMEEKFPKMVNNVKVIEITMEVLEAQEVVREKMEKVVSNQKETLQLNKVPIINHQKRHKSRSRNLSKHLNNSK